MSPDIHDLRGKLSKVRKAIERLESPVDSHCSMQSWTVDGETPPSKKQLRALESQICDNDRDILLLRSSITVLEGQVAELVAAMETMDTDTNSTQMYVGNGQSRNLGVRREAVKKQTSERAASERQIRTEARNVGDSTTPD